MTDLRDKRVLISGAAHGMGRRMAQRFSRQGSAVALVDVDQNALQQAADELAGPGRVVEAFGCDLSERAHIVGLHQDVLDRFGRIDILVNNAGVVAGGHYEDVDPAMDARMLRVNVDAVHWMTKEFLGDLKAGRDCHIVQMASAAGLMGVPNQAVYCASKWFVVGLSEALRQEFRDQDIDHIGISIICPSLVDTGMFDGANAPTLAPMLEADFMVDKIVEAVRQNDRYVREPWAVKVTPFLRAILPATVVDWLADTLGVTDLMDGFDGRS